MSGFAPKIYQQQVLDSVEAYFKACHELPSPSIAFTATTEPSKDDPAFGFFKRATKASLLDGTED